MLIEGDVVPKRILRHLDDMLRHGEDVVPSWTMANLGLKLMGVNFRLDN